MLPLPNPPPELALTRDEPLARHTYMRSGGPSAYFAEPNTIQHLRQIVAWARSVSLPIRIIGGGSNVLIADDPIEAVVLSLRRACGETTFEGSRVTAGGGVMLPALARAAAAHDLGGFEFAIGIPGTVGGALQSNAGISDRREIGPLVDIVTVLRSSEVITLSRADLQFDYRTSNLRGSGDIVLEAAFVLESRPRVECEAEMRRLLEARHATQPTAEHNAGSIFRNFESDTAGRLVDAAGCKGLTIGGAQISELHANFIVHDGSATTADIAALMLEVQRRVLASAGVHLTPEVEWWGDGAPPPAFPDEPWGGA
jgi:UDP-N-acetylmuramate dehydrogenase